MWRVHVVLNNLHSNLAMLQRLSKRRNMPGTTKLSKEEAIDWCKEWAKDRVRSLACQARQASVGLRQAWGTPFPFTQQSRLCVACKHKHGHVQLGHQAPLPLQVYITVGQNCWTMVHDFLTQHDGCQINDELKCALV